MNETEFRAAAHGRRPDGRSLATLRRIAREPLVHFLAAGGLLLALNGALRPMERRDRVVVSVAEIQQLREAWISRWQRRPSAAEIRRLVEDWIREEVLYREAIASGLDRNDTLVRRRLVQKVEFLAEGVAGAAAPTEEELRHFFRQHQDGYRIPPKVAFTHVYFTDQRGRSATRVALEVQERLKAGGIPPQEVASLGDPFMLQREYPLQSADEVKNLFGREFADRLFTLPVGSWEGPLRSSYGLHVVRVSAAAPGRVPPLDEVRDRVDGDFRRQRARDAVDAFYRNQLQKYRIEVDERALETAGE